jgi:hypothetical protein
MAQGQQPQGIDPGLMQQAQGMADQGQVDRVAEMMGNLPKPPAPAETVAQEPRV